MSSTLTIPRRPAGDSAPMSFAQELVWLLDRATPGLTAYNVPRGIRLRGVVDAEALRAAIEWLIARHEILRTTYASDASGPIQVIREPGRFEITHVDQRNTPPTDRTRAAEQFLLEQARSAFDLAVDAPLRAHLVKFADDDQLLVLVSHHIASDGWSKGVMFRELSSAYDAFAAGQTPSLPPLAIQYADFAHWQRAAVDGGSLAKPLAYWHERLAAPLPAHELPTEFARPALPSFEGGRQLTVLPTALVNQLRDVGMQHGATLYMVLLAAYHTVLHRYSGQSEVLTGSPTASRNHPEVEGLIGYFANTLAMRTSFADNPTLGELLEGISENAIGAYEHEDVPFEKLVLELRERQAADGNNSPTNASLFSCVLTMEDTLPDELHLGNAQVETLAIDFGMAKFDLTLLVAELPEGLRLALWYRSDLFSAAFADRFLGHMRSVLECIANAPETRVSKLQLLSTNEQAQLTTWNNTSVSEGAPATVNELFERQAAHVPSRMAVVAEDASLSYEQLNARANQLARHLQSLDVRASSTVGLLLDRSADAIVALLGILKAGAAYVPIAVDGPTNRVAQQIADSGVNVVISQAAQASRLPGDVTLVALDGDASIIAAYSIENTETPVKPEQLAYVLYTSGSTGVPKGVAVTHANIVHYARAVSRVLADVAPTDTGDGFAQLDNLKFGLVSTLAADLGNTALYPALLSGGTLHVLSSAVTTEPARFGEYVKTHALDIVKATPNHYLALAAGKTGAELKSVLPTRWLVFGGEALRLDVARTFLSANACRVLNHYGPTETTVGVCTQEVTSASLAFIEKQGAHTVPVGKPLANTCAFVVDAYGNEQPIAIPGELLLSGSGVTNGYLNRDDLTAERFVQHAGQRCYRTGDRVRRHVDGSIEFLGRTDDQVKVRGYRVELGEIEQVLRSHPGVANGTVVLQHNSGGDAQLVAFAVAKADGYAVSHTDRATVDGISSWLTERLPDHMVPQHVLLIDALPLTPNGKVDKARLPQLSQVETLKESVAPRTPTETIVARIWSEVLKRQDVGVRDRFLDLGGHSLLAIRVLGRISKELGVRLALRALFETPTIEQLAEIIDAERAARERERLQRAEEAAMLAALAAVEGLSDDEVALSLETDGPGDKR